MASRLPLSWVSTDWKLPVCEAGSSVRQAKEQES